jgi:hypothetical protein
MRVLLATLFTAGAAAAADAPPGPSLEFWAGASTVADTTNSGSGNLGITGGGSISLSRDSLVTVAAEGTASAFFIPGPFFIGTIGPALQVHPLDRLWLTVGPEIVLLKFPALEGSGADVISKGGAFVRISLPLGNPTTLVLRCAIFGGLGSRPSTTVMLSLALGGKT